jgi:cyclophilin family peptidyl-prolyl cis-trans isomerase
MQGFHFGLTTLLVISCASSLASAGEPAPTSADGPAIPVANSSAPAKDVALAQIDAFIATQKIDKTEKNWKLLIKAPGMAQFALDKTYYWHLETNRGDFKIKLLPEYAPFHVTNVIYLSRLGFYDDVIFHRVIPNFMAQSGDPTGTGQMGPGYRFGGEIHKDANHHKRGMVAMANAGPGTDGSQFFITFAALPSLDGKHTVFGELVEGKGTLRRFEKAGTKKGTGKPKQRLVIERATISVE